MTKVSILPVPTAKGCVSYVAISGGKQSQGGTAGMALDALTAQLPEDESGTLVVIQNLHPDRFFTFDQQQRLAELMARWRAARDGGGTLGSAEQAELDALIADELRASGERARELADGLGR